MSLATAPDAEVQKAMQALSVAMQSKAAVEAEQAHSALLSRLRALEQENAHLRRELQSRPAALPPPPARPHSDNGDGDALPAPARDGPHPENGGAPGPPLPHASPTWRTPKASPSMPTLFSLQPGARRQNGDWGSDDGDPSPRANAMPRGESMTRLPHPTAKLTRAANGRPHIEGFHELQDPLASNPVTPHGAKKALFQLLACYENKCEVMLPSPTSGAITIERQTHSLLQFAWLTPPRVGLIVRKPNDEAVDVAARLVADFLLAEGVRVLVEPATFTALSSASASSSSPAAAPPPVETWAPGGEALLQECVDFVVSLGGDGTLIYAAKYFPSGMPPVISFALGSLGFLTAHPISGYTAALTDLLRGDFNVTLRTRLECGILKAGSADAPGSAPPEMLTVLNEVVVDRGVSNCLVDLACFCDGQPMTRLRADGLIVGTPTGSTAYSLAAGGSMVHPGVSAMLFTPICPHALSCRPLILPDSVLLRIKVHESSRCTAWVAFDGRDRQELQRGDTLLIRVSPSPLPAVCRKGENEDWFTAVKNVMYWNWRKRPSPAERLIPPPPPQGAGGAAAGAGAPHQQGQQKRPSGTGGGAEGSSDALGALSPASSIGALSGNGLHGSSSGGEQPPPLRLPPAASAPVAAAAAAAAYLASALHAPRGGGGGGAAASSAAPLHPHPHVRFSDSGAAWRQGAPAPGLGPARAASAAPGDCAPCAAAAAAQGIPHGNWDEYADEEEARAARRRAASGCAACGRGGCGGACAGAGEGGRGPGLPGDLPPGVAVSAGGCGDAPELARANRPLPRSSTSDVFDAVSVGASAADSESETDGDADGGGAADGLPRILLKVRTGVAGRGQHGADPAPAEAADPWAAGGGGAQQHAAGGGSETAAKNGHHQHQ